MTTHNDGLYEIDPNFSVKPRRTPDENAQAAWDQALVMVAMCESMVLSGARVQVVRSRHLPDDRSKEYLALGIMSMVERILQSAEVVE